MLMKGIEPPAYALRVRCSTPELHQLIGFSKPVVLRRTFNSLLFFAREVNPFVHIFFRKNFRAYGAGAVTPCKGLKAVV